MAVSSPCIGLAPCRSPLASAAALGIVVLGGRPRRVNTLRFLILSLLRWVSVLAWPPVRSPRYGLPRFSRPIGGLLRQSIAECPARQRRHSRSIGSYHPRWLAACCRDFLRLSPSKHDLPRPAGHPAPASGCPAA